MARRPWTWWTVSSVSFTPAETFFGLDKQKAHTFVVAKGVDLMGNEELRKYLWPEPESEDSSDTFRQTTAIELIVIDTDGGWAEVCDAELRYSHPQGRTVIHMQWKKFTQTQDAIRRCFKAAYTEVEKGNGAEPHRGVVHHLGGRRFAMERWSVAAEVDDDFPTRCT
jgi:hypothetical protein